ncbi:DUF2264 domain-containing protein [Paenibacillus sp. TRM 82003]|nr:DUF2264 domain-containing protein [Paenibacillus sp. TRM 82003]
MNPIQQNPLATREHLQHALDQLCEPLRPYYSAGKARLRLGHSGAGCRASTVEMEGFSRVLWGLVPLAAGGGDSPLWDVAVEGLRNGTNPAHEEYWGEPGDYDQLLVEMGAIGFALALAPERVWAPLSDEEKSRLYAWLNSVNGRKLWDCNWLFFQVIVNLGFRSVGLPYDAERMRLYLDRIDDFYVADGWYTDGERGASHCDYYGPFAIHFYGLLYAVLMAEEDPERSATYKDRAALFAQDFIHWFAGDGSALPYGRSLAYRFAQSAFWAAMAYAGVEAFPMGVLKGLLLRNLRWWFRQPIFHANGTLTIGYAYPNLIMAENYNAPGSPYWALKSFLPLALAPDHPFWLAEELPLPPLDASRVEEEPRMIVCRQPERSHVVAFVAGYEHTNQHTHTSAKYEKFAYSNAFGFSVPRAEWGLAQGAFDSMLALSEGDNLYRVKRKVEAYQVGDDLVSMRWKPWRDVEVTTWIVPGAPWHVRLHRIRTGRELDAADGGFALGIDGPEDQGREPYRGSTQDGGAFAVSSLGACGALPMFGGGEAALVVPHSNTNLMFPRTVIPTVAARLAPGTHWLAAAFYGQPGADGASAWSAAPSLERRDGGWIVRGCSASAKDVRIEAVE